MGYYDSYGRWTEGSNNPADREADRRVVELERRLNSTLAEKSQTMEILRQAKMKLQEQDEVLRRLASPPFLRGLVIRFSKASTGKTALVSVDGRVIETRAPDALKLKNGDWVRLNHETMAIVEADSEPGVPNGNVLSVERVVDANSVEVTVAGELRMISTFDGMKVQRGDRLVVDDSVSVALSNLGKSEQKFTVEQAINVSWDEIGGLKAAKEEMVEAIEGPVRHAKIFKAYGKKPVKGILLFGPPGCGKTMLAKAAATSLATLHGATSTSGFLYVKGPEILNKYVGTSEATIRSLFDRARQHKRDHGYPAVLFIDEAEAILSSRGTGVSSDMERTIVPTFLAEMDGLDEDGPLVLLATNRSDQLDAAIVRDGRIDRKIEVTRPGLEDTADIFKMYMKSKPFEVGTLDAMAKHFAERVFSGSLQYRVCGALVAGAVEQAVSSAMRRDIAENRNAPTGIKLQDVDAAITALQIQNSKVL